MINSSQWQKINKCNAPIEDDDVFMVSFLLLRKREREGER